MIANLVDYPNVTVTLPFTVTVNPLRAPYFATELTQIFTVDAGAAWSYTIPTCTYLQGASCSVTAQLNSAFLFVSFETDTLRIVSASTSNLNAGNYQIKIILTDEYGGVNSYAISLTIKSNTILGPTTTNSTPANTNQTN